MDYGKACRLCLESSGMLVVVPPISVIELGSWWYLLPTVIVGNAGVEMWKGLLTALYLFLACSFSPVRAWYGTRPPR